MLMQRLFSAGIMKMGLSRLDPGRQVGVFDPNFLAGLPALRAAEMEKFRWIVGEWSYDNACQPLRFPRPTPTSAQSSLPSQKTATGSASFLPTAARCRTLP